MKRLALFLVFSITAWPQGIQPNLAVASGTVTAEGGGPLAGVKVILGADIDRVMATGAPGTLKEQSTTTNDQGAFTFQNVAPGNYMLVAQAVGYLTYGGERGANRAQVAVKAGDRISGLRIPMTRLGVISGRIASADGEPVQGVAVHAARWSYTGGIRQLEEQGLSGISDDRGSFRIISLPPGSYFVYAIPKSQSPSVSEIVRTVLPTYAPNGLSVSEALPLQVLAGGQAVADIRLRQDKQYSIRGKVTGPSEQLAGAVVLVMEDAETPALVKTPSSGRTPYTPPYVAITRTGSDGSFNLPGVLAGRHRLFAFGGARVPLNFGSKGFVTLSSGEPQTPDEGAAGVAEVSISDRNAEGISIALVPAATIKRNISVAGTTFADWQMDVMKRFGAEISPQIASMVQDRLPPVLLIPELRVASGGRYPDQASDVKAATQRVSPGRYFLDVQGIQQQLYVKTVRLSGTDITRKALEITGGTAELEVVLAADGARVTGTVADRDGKPSSGAKISLWPVTPDLMKQNGGAIVEGSANDGSFTHFNVPPGEYYAAAFESLPDTGLGQYPPFLAQFSGRAERVRVEAGGTGTVNLKLISRSDTERAIGLLPR